MRDHFEIFKQSYIRFEVYKKDGSTFTRRTEIDEPTKVIRIEKANEMFSEPVQEKAI